MAPGPRRRHGSAATYAGAAPVAHIVCPHGTSFSMGSTSTHCRSATRVGGLEIEDLWQGLETVVHFKEPFQQVVVSAQN
jgi:hypothetical protein